jgi:hypothetical protein
MNTKFLWQLMARKSWDIESIYSTFILTLYRIYDIVLWWHDCLICTSPVQFLHTPNINAVFRNYIRSHSVFLRRMWSIFEVKINFKIFGLRRLLILTAYKKLF